VSKFITQLAATSAAYVLYHSNHFLRILADLFVSDTLDNLSNKYSAWYNLYLITQVINFTSHGKVVSYVSITELETIDSMLIAQISYGGLTHVELELYLLKSLRTINGINLDSFQLTKMSKGHAKLIFSMLS